MKCNADPRFLADVARWSLGRAQPEWTVGVGVRLLMAGFDTPEIRLLAGGERAEGGQLREWFDQALRDLGWHMDTEAACRWLAMRAAREIVTGVVLPEVGAREIGNLWCDFIAWPTGDDAQPIEIEDGREWAYFEGVAGEDPKWYRRATIDAARRFLERHEGLFPPAPEES